MKRIADEGKPVVVVPIVLEQIEVRIPLRTVEPDVRDMIVALERMYRIPSMALPLECSWGCILFGI